MLRTQPELAKGTVMRPAAFRVRPPVALSRRTGILWVGIVCVAPWVPALSQVSTGNLLVILSRHYQDVSCLTFTGDGSHFVSAGKDCLVLAWSLCR